jgi:hypothetical protein
VLAWHSTLSALAPINSADTAPLTSSHPSSSKLISSKTITATSDLDATFSTSMLDSDTPPEAVKRAVDLSRLKEKGIDFIKLARTQTANLTDKAADGLNEAKDQLIAIEYSELPQEVLDWIKEHPHQTVFHVVSGVVFFAPGVITTPITTPLLSWLGFSASGPVAGKFILGCEDRASY